tara:strand:+ start:269 stop:649 length:381 start_codon:yes stop_codon:yes gene_type:complete
MNISEKKINNKRIFSVQVINRSSTKKINISLNNILTTLSSKYDLSEWKFINTESSKGLTNSSSTGTYVFLKKQVDNKIENVKIDQTIEAEPPQVEEQKNEASLPYGLKKQAKTKKKKATKKKITEE